MAEEESVFELYRKKDYINFLKTVVQLLEKRKDDYRLYDKFDHSICTSLKEVKYDEDYKLFLLWLEKEGCSNSNVQNLLGLIYSGSHGVEKNYERAYEYFQRSVDLGNEYAKINIGDMYFYGQYVKQDHLQALAWYKLSCVANGYYQVGQMYYMGHGVDVDLKEAFKWIKLGAERGNGSAQNFLGNMYFKGEGTGVDMMKAFELHRLSADQGNFKAQFNLGHMYENGFYVDSDNDLAFKWYKLSADSGYSRAQNMLGDMYYFGEGTSKDMAKAFEMYQLSARQGDAEGQYNLGHMYHYPFHVELNYEEAFKWFQLSADQNYLHGLNSLAQMYLNGEHVDVNDEEAFRLFKLGYEAGSAKSCYQLAIMYRDGLGTNINLDEAIKLFNEYIESADDYDDDDPFIQLGEIYENKKEYKLALEWYKKSEDNKTGEAQERIRDVFRIIINDDNHYPELCNLYFNYQKMSDELEEIRYRPPEQGGPGYETAKSSYLQTVSTNQH